MSSKCLDVRCLSSGGSNFGLWPIAPYLICQLFQPFRGLGRCIAFSISWTAEAASSSKSRGCSFNTCPASCGLPSIRTPRPASHILRNSRLALTVETMVPILSPASHARPLGLKPTIRYVATIFSLNIDIAHRATFRFRFAKRTPGPPPFSAMNSTPASFNVSSIFCSVPAIDSAPFSTRLIVLGVRPARAASSRTPHFRAALAILI